MEKVIEKDEIDYYRELTKQQKDIVDALKNLGFTWKYFHNYELSNWGVIDVKKIHSLSELLTIVHEQGKDQKRFEIQRALGI